MTKSPPSCLKCLELICNFKLLRFSIIIILTVEYNTTSIGRGTIGAIGAMGTHGSLLITNPSVILTNQIGLGHLV